MIYGSVLGIRYQAPATAHDLTWVILNFYVPVLWGTLVLVTWQLTTRRSELLGAPTQEPAGLDAGLRAQ